MAGDHEVSTGKNSLLVLKRTKEESYRLRMVKEGAGNELALVARDSQYDPKTRAAAAALWLDVSKTTEGSNSSWWGSTFNDVEQGDLSWPTDPDHQWIRAQVLMQVPTQLRSPLKSFSTKEKSQTRFYNHFLSREVQSLSPFSPIENVNKKNRSRSSGA